MSIHFCLQLHYLIDYVEIHATWLLLLRQTLVVHGQIPISAPDFPRAMVTSRSDFWGFVYVLW